MRGMYTLPPVGKTLKRRIAEAGEDAEWALDEMFRRMALKTPEWACDIPLLSTWVYRERWFADYLVKQGIKRDQAKRYAKIEARYRQWLAQQYGEERIADSRLDVRFDGGQGRVPVFRWSIGAVKFA